MVWVEESCGWLETEGAQLLEMPQRFDEVEGRVVEGRVVDEH